MPVTGIKTTDKEGNELRLQFMTLQHPDGMQLDIYQCDENWIPVGKPDSQFEKGADEIAYHKALREDAVKEGQFVQAASSNPEWTPGYKEPEENGDADLAEQEV